MARRTRKTVGPGRVERTVKQGPRASVVRGGKGQAGSAANRKGKAAKDEVPWNQEAVGVDILKAERGKAVKARTNRQKPVAQTASSSAVFLEGLQDLRGDLEILQDARLDEFEAAEELWGAFREKWDQEKRFLTTLRDILTKVEARNA